MRSDLIFLSLREMNGRPLIRSVFAGFFMLLFAVFYVNATMFWHCHIINGVTIVHSHIHTASHHNTSNGAHSESSLTLIDAINTLECLEDVGGQLFDFTAYRTLCAVLLLPTLVVTAVVSLRLFSLRAPPAEC